MPTHRLLPCTENADGPNFVRPLQPELAQAITVARAFRAMVRGQRTRELDNWLLTADGTPLADFANGLQRDLAAVRAALSLPWSTGPVEGQISRLKTIKRMMKAASICCVIA